MASYNNITLLGNIGNVQVKTFQNGGKIVEATLATSKRWKDRNGEPREETQWHNLNIGGNLAALSPLAFFLPLFWRPMRRAYVFLPTVVLTAAAIEALQFAFMRGSCDIDDLLLNAGGAVAVYLLLRIPPVSRLVRRFCGGLWDAPTVRA